MILLQKKDYGRNLGKVFWKKRDLESEEFKKLNREIIILKQDIERLDLDLLLWKKNHIGE
jgi:hypothetical protein